MVARILFAMLVVCTVGGYAATVEMSKYMRVSIHKFISNYNNTCNDAAVASYMYYPGTNEGLCTRLTMNEYFGSYTYGSALGKAGDQLIEFYSGKYCASDGTKLFTIDSNCLTFNATANATDRVAVRLESVDTGLPSYGIMAVTDTGKAALSASSCQEWCEQDEPTRNTCSELQYWPIGECIAYTSTRWAFYSYCSSVAVAESFYSDKQCSVPANVGAEGSTMISNVISPTTCTMYNSGNLNYPSWNGQYKYRKYCVAFSAAPTRVGSAVWSVAGIVAAVITLLFQV